MKRLIDQSLRIWKEKERRKPLLIRGARQVGKTWTIERFGKEEFDTFIKIDFEKQPRLRQFFNGDISTQKICADLEVVAEKKIVPGKTLLFLDEIQACPRAIIALRYFYEEMPHLHVIAAGSLLEFALQEISFPVGRIQTMEMYPMGFIEFLHALGREQAIRQLYDEPHPLSDAIHSALTELTRDYFFVGGMPEAVNVFAGTHSILEAHEALQEIVNAYRLDFGKYAGHADRQCLEDVLNAVAHSVGKQIKYSSLSDGFSFNTIKKAFHLFTLARIVRRVPSVNPSGLPLEVSASSKIFKALPVDIGIFHQLCGLQLAEEYQKHNLLDAYRGALAEQYIGQELLLATQSGPYYWSKSGRNSVAEVDYVFNRGNQVLPVEVKSGGGKKAKSLRLFLDTYKSAPCGILFSPAPYTEDAAARIKNIPFYYAAKAFGCREDMLR